MQNTIKWVGTGIVFTLLCTIVWHLQYKGYAGSTAIGACGLTAVPIAIILCHKLHCLIRLLLMVLYVPILFILLLSGMCAYTPTGKAYVCKKNRNVFIVEKSLDCGAWDSSPAYYMEKEIHLTTHLKYVSGYNGMPDTTEWKITKP